MSLKLNLALSSAFFLAFCSLASTANAADAYCTHISKNDKMASDGTVLKDAASIIRQDRANVHKFGKADPGDQVDATFADAAQRAKIPALLAKGKLDPAIANEIVSGTPVICAEIAEGDELLVMLSSEAAFAERTYPFTGKWQCGDKVFTLSSTHFNDGEKDRPVIEAQETDNGSYALFLTEESLFIVSDFTKTTMTWTLPETEETRQCKRIE